MKTCPFKIVIDTNEKIPWAFQGMRMKIGRTLQEVKVETIERRLPENCGDYMVGGMDHFAIEKKEDAAELYATLGKRSDFEEQVALMDFTFRISWIIIGSTWEEICDPQKFNDDWRSELNPRSVFATGASWQDRYPRVPWIAAGWRRLAELMAFERLEKAWRHEQERKQRAIVKFA